MCANTRQFFYRKTVNIFRLIFEHIFWESSCDCGERKTDWVFFCQCGCIYFSTSSLQKVLCNSLNIHILQQSVCVCVCVCARAHMCMHECASYLSDRMFQCHRITPEAYQCIAIDQAVDFICDLLNTHTAELLSVNHNYLCFTIVCICLGQ